MANIRPFRAYRPAPGMAGRIAALPYDVYSREEACEAVGKNPDSFLAIDRAETQFGMETDMYAPEVYAKAREMLAARIAEGSFIQEEFPCYYLYELTMDGRSQTGVVACASIDDYSNQVIKKHENTRADKEQDRINHVDACNMQTGPIFLAYRQNEALRDIVKAQKEKEPVYDFVSEDGVGHRCWVVGDRAAVEGIRAAFEAIPAIYIADGHHRCASAVKVGQKRRQEHPDYTGGEEFNFFLSVLFPDEELRILDYNRVVKDLNGLDGEEFLDRVSRHFAVRLEKKGNSTESSWGRDRCHIGYAPEKKGQFGMYLDGVWYSLTANPEIRSGDVVEGLDVSLLQNHLLAPILGIGDPRTDGRIDFVGGIRGLGELERRCSTDMRVAFSMYPTSIEELFAVADAGRLMPPKSTWFEPKLRSGLFLHGLED